MDKEVLIANIYKFADRNKESASAACIASGCGKSFISDMRRGQTPSVSKIIDLAAHLGVSVSDLVGDAATPAELAPLASAWAELNDEGRERLVAYAEDLVAGGRYIKSDPAGIFKEA